MKHSLLKYFTKPPKDNIFHSSTYARTGNQSTFGSASSESFSARRDLDRNRKIIKSYNDSRIASGATNLRPRPKTYTPPSTSNAKPPVPPRPNFPSSSR